MRAKKTRCSNQWTEARYNSFIKSGIRSLTRKWKPMFDALKDAATEKKVNAKTGRIAQHYKCAHCGGQFPVKEVAIDHINGVVSECGFDSWDEVISRALCEKDGFQVLCKHCHDKKSKGENLDRKSWKEVKEKYPREFNSWHSMNRRCFDKNYRSYPWYGGVGISVCEEWDQSRKLEGFYKFLEDMGNRPESHTLDRINSSKDYSLENCRWATNLEQGRNTSRNVWVEIGGDILSMSQCEEKYGISATLIARRLRKGWTPEEAVGIKSKSTSSYISNLTEEDLNLIRNSKVSNSKTGELLGLTGDQVKWIKKKFQI